MKHGVIVAALPRELRPLVRGWTHSRREGADVWERPGVPGAAWKWTAACAGIGSRPALQALAAAEAIGGPAARIISAGFAGALTNECLPGRVYCPATLVDQATRARIALKDDVARAFYKPPGQEPVTGGPGVGFCPDLVLVTLDKVATVSRKPALAWLYQAHLADMEAAALADAALARKIPFACLKGVSDGPRDHLPTGPSLIGQNNRPRYGRFILYAVLHPVLWPSLMRIARNSAEAARGLKSGLEAVMDDAS